MKEDYLHYLWNYKKFDLSDLKTTLDETITIINSGFYSQLAGPDFFNAQIIIGNQKWAGNVEIHLKSSDWYVHHHEKDDNYNNVILHVVWENDSPIFRKDNTEIPVLEIKNYVSKEELRKYNELSTVKTWIFCENQLNGIDGFVIKNWQERLFFERLERKSISVQNLLDTTENDWEAVLFSMLSKSFGLNTNGIIFLKIAQSIPFNVIRKESSDLMNLEAIFFGRAGLLDDEKEDSYFKDLKNRWLYIENKYQLPKIIIEPVQFFKHRPDNFPTVRLAQLAQLYHLQQNLFSKIIEIKSVKDFYKTFDVKVSEYWESHYQFDKESPKKRKAITHSFTDLIIINTIIPILFSYYKSIGKEVSEELIEILSNLPLEKNTIVEKFSSIGLKSHNAYESQSLLQLKNEYCNYKKCLQCRIGLELLKQ